MNPNNSSTDRTTSYQTENYTDENGVTERYTGEKYTGEKYTGEQERHRTVNDISRLLEGEEPLTPPAGLPSGAAWRFLFKESFQVILPALLLAFTVHLFLAQATIVYGQSMEPNLYERERLIIDKISYRLHPPRRNDIVVLDLPGMDEMLVKRVIGLPGETIEIRNGVVLVNNVELFEPFPHELGHQDMEPVVLGPLSYFVLGDNRENSNDSRSFGSVQREFILGRVWLRYWPLNHLKYF